jgi:hypothetical protein
VPYRDDLESMRARLAAMEAELAQAREEAERLKLALVHRGPHTPLERPVIPRPPDVRWRSIPGGEPTPVTLINESPRKIELYWLSYDGRERSAGTLVPGGRIRAQTYVGHCWRVVDADTGAILAHEHVKPEDEPVIAYRDPLIPDTE